MQITRQTEYAIRALMELASAPPGEFLQSCSIAEKHGLPEKFLKKTIQRLVRAGLIESKRGMHGGIKLIVAPDNITINDIITAIEGKIAINTCLDAGFRCQHRSVCKVSPILKRAQNAMIVELNRETLADLVLVRDQR